MAYVPYSGRRLWTLTKLWLALRDVPEVGALMFLGSSVITMGVYTYYREMWTAAGESFPNIEVRRDPEKQLALTEAAHNRRSFFYRVAQLKVDDKGYNVGIFDNRYRPFEYNLPTQGKAHSGAQYESDVSTKAVTM